MLEGKQERSNIACRAEFGRFPVNITIIKKFSKRRGGTSFDLHCNDKKIHSHLMNMSEYFKLPDFNPDLLDIATCMVKSYVSSMNQEYISYSQNTLQHFQKLEFYRSFKTDQLPCTKSLVKSMVSLVNHG